MSPPPVSRVAVRHEYVADPLIAMGRTNDTILFGGQVQLFVSCGDEQAEDLARRLPSGNSGDYGKPFAEVFRDYGYDFFRIDPMLFSPGPGGGDGAGQRPYLSRGAPGRRGAGTLLRRRRLIPEPG